MATVLTSTVCVLPFPENEVCRLNLRIRTGFPWNGNAYFTLGTTEALFPKKKKKKSTFMHTVYRLTGMFSKVN